MERQQQDGTGIVAIQPGSLALARPESEELLEYLLVDHDAADQRHQHRHRGKTHQPDAQQARHVQRVMEAEEEIAAYRLARLQHLAAERVEIGTLTASLFTGRYRQRRRALGRQADVPARRVRMLGFQPALGRPGRCRLIHPALAQLRLHPHVQFLVEDRDRAGEKDGEQHPAEQQPAPGMQPGHGLGDGFRFHPSLSSNCGQKPISASGGMTSRLVATRRNECVANTQRMNAR